MNVGNLGQFIEKKFSTEVKVSKNTLYPLDSESRRKIVSPVSRFAGLSFFNCNARNPKKLEGTIESVGLGTVIAKSNNKKYSLSISACTVISSTGS